MKLWKLVLVGTFCISSTALPAGGFGSSEQGVQGFGSAGAFVARAEDGSAIYYNPAGLAALKFNELAFSIQPVSSRSYYSNSGQDRWASEKYFNVHPSAFWNMKFGKFAFGLGTASTFDYEVDWQENDFPGRFLSNRFEFRVREALAAAAYRFNDRLSAGLTLRFAAAEFRHDRVLAARVAGAQPDLFYEVGEKIESDGQDVGFTLGLQYYANRKFSLGAAYQSAIEFNLDGDRAFSLLTRQNDQRVTGDFGQTFAPAALSQKFEIPERFQIGFTTRVTVRTRLETDISYEGWSSVERYEFQSADSDTTPGTVLIPRNWDDIYAIKIGGDFLQRRALLWRIGIGYNNSPVPGDTVDPSFPDYDQFQYSFGVTYTWLEKYIFEGGILYIQNRDRFATDQEFQFQSNQSNNLVATGQEGLYETQRWMLSFGMRIRLGVAAKRTR